MFVHQEQLEHLLAPRDYYDPGVHQREREALFLPGWHLLAAKAELPRHGDFLTRDVLGEPVLLRNDRGVPHAYLNVCGHRHCRLTGLARGRQETLRCQYHGWEYQADGRTARIPDAHCFRPFDRQNARLVTFRTATCGELVYVSLADDGPSLEEFLGPFYPTCAAWFARPYGLKWTYEAEYRCNWKVPVENSLESYHVPCLHAKTFGTYPEESQCEHDLQEDYTTFRTPEPDQPTTHIQRWFVRRLGLPETGVYTQHHAHPHITFASLDVFRLAQIFLPTSPTSCRHLVWLYAPKPTGWNPLRRLLAVTLAGLVKWVSRQVVLEDVAVYAEVQRGLEASRCKGVIGTREERVYVFQQWVRKKMQRGADLAIMP